MSESEPSGVDVEEETKDTIHIGKAEKRNLILDVLPTSTIFFTRELNNISSEER